MSLLTSFAALAATGTAAYAGSIYYYWNHDGTCCWNSGAIQGSGTTSSPPAIVHNDHLNATEIAAATSDYSLDYWSNTDGTCCWSEERPVTEVDPYATPAMAYNPHSGGHTEIWEPDWFGDSYYYWKDDALGYWQHSVQLSGGNDFFHAIVHNDHSDTTEVAVVYPDGSLYYYWNNDGSPTWQSAVVAAGPGSVYKYARPAIVHNDQSNTTEIAAEGPNNSLVYYWNTDGSPFWNGGVVPGSAGSTFSGPAIVHNDHFSATEIVAQGPNNSLYYYGNQDGTCCWNSSVIVGSGTTFSAPAMVRNNAGNNTEVAAEGPDNTLEYHWNHDGSTNWYGGVVPGSAGNTSSAPAIVHNNANNNTEIAVVGP